MSPTVQHRWSSFLAGEEVDGRGEPLGVENPYTEQVFAEIARSTSEEVDHAISAARSAQEDGAWATMAPRERSRLLWRMAEVLSGWRDEIVETHIAETGMYRMLNEMAGVHQPLEWMFDYAELAGRDRDHAIPPASMDVGLGTRLAGGMVYLEPAGVVSAIVPFNFPFFVAVHKVGAALAAGCSVVLKASELTPLSGTYLARAAAEAGLPPGALNYVVGEADVGRRMVEHPDVDVVSFTGSTAVGREIGAVVGGRIARVVLELGGKSAAVVLEDADLDAASPILLGQLSHGGQGCALNTRLVVHESVADEVVARLAAMIPYLVAGDPAEPTTTHAPQITAAARERVLRYIAQGAEAGAELVAGGGPIEEQPHGHWVQPTVFDRCPVDAAVAQEEIFGPVLVVHRFDAEEEAVRIANDSRFGLWGSVWTRDLDRGMRLARRIRSGGVGVNGMALNFHAPFGGVKDSGIGREFGEYGVREFLEPKSVSWMP